MNEYGCLNKISCSPPASSTSTELRMSSPAKSRRDHLSGFAPIIASGCGLAPDKGICLPRTQGAVIMQQILRAQPLGPALISVPHPFSIHVPHSSATDICQPWFYPVAPVFVRPAGGPGGYDLPGGRGDRNKAHRRMGSASGRAASRAGLPTGRSNRMGLCARIARVARPVRRRVAECRRASRLEKGDGG